MLRICCTCHSGSSLSHPAARERCKPNAKIQHMHRTSVLTLTAVLLWPLAARANDVDLAELGVRLSTLPGTVTQPQVSQRPGGYDAVIRLGLATLEIYREDDPAPVGSDVADPHYRALLDRRYRGGVEAKTLGAPTALGGHSAWTVVDTREDSSSDVTHYTCLSYVIVDQHLYRLAVTADGSPGRPPEFDSLVKALSGVSFEQVQRPNRG